ncbi:MAG TPA: SNF2-related protein, partial [Cyclobacteriaceae bacterium]|nr:SNF2-related protein [Cyclobacteriaceae bacterium]
FYSSFVTKVVEKFDVYPEGFQIETVSNQFRSSLHMQQKLDGNYHLALFFNYELDTVHYLSSREVMVKLDYSPKAVHFRRLRRNNRKEHQIVKFLLGLGLHENHENGFELPSSDLYALVQWVATHSDDLKEHNIRIEQSEQSKKFVFAPSEVKMDISQVNDWFDVHATVTFGAFEIPFIRLKNHILKNINEFALPDGSTAIIPPEWFTRFAAMFSLNEGNEEEIKIRAYHYGVIEQMQSDEKSGIRNPFTLKQDKIIEPVALPVQLNATLRPYQRQGFYWFYFLQKHKIGGILADDMGLGKTLQTLTLLQKEKELFPAHMPETDITEEAEAAAPVHTQQETTPPAETPVIPIQLDLFAATTPPAAIQPLKESKPEAVKKPGNKTLRRTSLIVVPSSLVYNWYSEAKKFTPGLRLFIHSGNQRVKSLQLFAQYDVVVTTYGVLRKDINLFKEAYFHYIILDEGQAIKNSSSLVAQSVYQLQSRYKLVLTGTPVENTLRDLWSQLHFLNPDFLGSQQSFQHQYAIPIEKNQHYVKLEELKAITRPFLLRRTKELVAPDLPDKTEFTVACDMTDEQREFYEKTKSQYRNEIIKTITEEGFAKSKLQVLTGLMKLRQIANHPSLHDSEYRGESGKFNDIVSKVESVISEQHK